jgi:hypothetical protein
MYLILIANKTNKQISTVSSDKIAVLGVGFDIYWMLQSLLKYIRLGIRESPVLCGGK